eukprot:scaffold5578_cov157-Skeletonema_marinoi.AAC.10
MSMLQTVELVWKMSSQLNAIFSCKKTPLFRYRGRKSCSANQQSTILLDAYVIYLIPEWQRISIS